MDSGNKNSEVRKATHAGSWYKEDKEKLSEDLEGYLNLAEKTLAHGGDR